jgi:hypothetical protein
MTQLVRMQILKDLQSHGSRIGSSKGVAPTAIACIVARRRLAGRKAGARILKELGLCGARFSRLYATDESLNCRSNSRSPAI